MVPSLAISFQLGLDRIRHLPALVRLRHRALALDVHERWAAKAGLEDQVTATLLAWRSKALFAEFAELPEGDALWPTPQPLDHFLLLLSHPLDGAINGTNESRGVARKPCSASSLTPGGNPVPGSWMAAAPGPC